MKLLQLNPHDDEATALDLHPRLTVVTDLSSVGRDRLVRAATALARADDPGSPGLIEAHGILLDLSSEMLQLLDLDGDQAVIVTADDVAGVIKAAARARSAGLPPLTPEAFLAVTPAGVFTDLDELRARQRQAREALELLRQARDAARRSLEDARVHLRRIELTLESASGAARRHLQLVGDEEASEPADDPAALEARRRELEATVARIDRGVAELASVDVRPIQVLLDAIRNPQPTELVPSERAQQLADQISMFQREEAIREESLEARGLGYRAALVRLESTRATLAAAEAAMRPPEFTEQDQVELEAAHDEVLDAERKARGRGGRRRLEQAVEHEQAILDRMGFPTWSAYVMGATLMAIDPAAEQRLEQARFELEAAEQHWSNVTAMIDTDPEHRDVLDRLEQLYVEAYALLGGEQDPSDIEARLRAVRVPASEVSRDELVDALAYQLQLIGMGLPESVTSERVVLTADAFLQEATAIQDRIVELSDERVEALIDLEEVKERLQALGVVGPAATHDDHPSVGSGVAAEQDLDALESQLESARRDEHDYAEMVEARDTLVDAAIQVETVATGRLHRRAGEVVQAITADAGAGGGGDGTVAYVVEAYLRERAVALEGASYAGSVPLLVDDALVELDRAGKEQAILRLDQLSDEVQVVYVTNDDRAIIDWAARVGFRRAAVVHAPAGFN